MRRPPSPAGTGTDDDKGVTELATVPVIKEHNDQSAISTQDNVAYGGTIPLKQNELEVYEQVHINWDYTDELSRTYYCTVCGSK